MKIIYIIFISLLYGSTSVHAQGNSQINNIKIGEITLSELPAISFNRLNGEMEKLANWNEEQLIDLIKTLRPANEVDNSKTEYALSGLTGYVSAPGKEVLRKKVALSYAKALAKNTDPQASSFIMSQLQVIGGDESVPYLKVFLSQDELVVPSSSALVGIGSIAAKKELTEALKKAKKGTIVPIIAAIGYQKDASSVQMVSPFAKSKDDDIRKMAYFSLAAIADLSSADILKKAAADSKYRFDNTQAFASYLTYIKNIATRGRKEFAEQLSNELMIKTKDQEVQARIAALQMFVSLKGDKSLAKIDEALKDENKTYRVATLKIAEPYMNAPFWINQLKTAKPELQIELMQLFGNKNIRALPIVKSLLNSPNKEVKIAAIKAAGQLGGEAVVPDYLAILKNNVPEEVTAVKAAFLTMKGANVSKLLTAALPDLSLGAKSVLLSVLDNRGAKESATVYPVKEFNAEADKKEGFHILFDGTNMDQWTGNTKDYTIEYGEMVINPTKGSGGNLYTKEEFADFIFRFEFKLSEGANNGLGVRTPLTGNAAYDGIEIQIIDNDAETYKYLKPYQYHGSLYGIMAAKRGFLNPVDMWNYQEVQIKGDHFKVILNGNVILDASIAEAKANGTLDSKEHPGLNRTTGHIGFLGHGSKVYFRNMRIKKI
jgi:HEAT repeat protein